MAFDYASMQATATGLLGEFAQGVVSLRRATVTPGANPWDPPTRTTADTPLSAVVKRMHQRYENGVLIVETGDQVIFNVPAVEPLLSDQLVIGGKARAITSLTPIPPSGTVVVYKAWCAG
jgi:hypothetical protein